MALQSSKFRCPQGLFFNLCLSLGSTMISPLGPPWRARRECASLDQCFLNPIRAVLLLWFFTFWKFDCKGFNDWKCLKNFDMQDKVLRKWPAMSCSLPMSLITSPSLPPLIYTLCSIHKKFTQFSGIFWRYFIISCLHLFTCAGLFCFVFFDVFFYFGNKNVQI